MAEQKQADFTLYTTTYCGYCTSAKTLLQSKGYTYNDIDVTHDDAQRQRLIEVTGRRTVPQIYHGNTYVGGYDELVIYLKEQKS